MGRDFIWIISDKKHGEVCGLLIAGPPNQSHKVLEGKCENDLKCVKSKFIEEGRVKLFQDLSLYF